MKNEDRGTDLVSCTFWNVRAYLRVFCLCGTANLPGERVTKRECRRIVGFPHVEPCGGEWCGWMRCRRERCGGKIAGRGRRCRMLRGWGRGRRGPESKGARRFTVGGGEGELSEKFFWPCSGWSLVHRTQDDLQPEACLLTPTIVDQMLGHFMLKKVSNRTGRWANRKRLEALRVERLGNVAWSQETT